MMFQNLCRMMVGSATLKVECEACQRRATWTQAEAFARFGPDAMPYDIRRRLVCGGCGTTGWARVWI